MKRNIENGTLRVKELYAEEQIKVNELIQMRSLDTSCRISLRGIRAELDFGALSIGYDETSFSGLTFGMPLVKMNGLEVNGTVTANEFKTTTSTTSTENMLDNSIIEQNGGGAVRTLVLGRRDCVALPERRAVA